MKKRRQSVTDHFPPNHKNIINPKPLKLRTWNFERRFTSPHMSRVICHMSHVTCHMQFLISFSFSLQRFEGSWWRVFYWWGLPRLVLIAYIYCFKCFKTTNLLIFFVNPTLTNLIVSPPPQPPSHCIIQYNRDSSHFLTRPFTFMKPHNTRSHMKQDHSSLPVTSLLTKNDLITH